MLSGFYPLNRELCLSKCRRRVINLRILFCSQPCGRRHGEVEVHAKLHERHCQIRGNDSQVSGWCMDACAACLSSTVDYYVAFNELLSHERDG